MDKKITMIANIVFHTVFGSVLSGCNMFAWILLSDHEDDEYYIGLPLGVFIIISMLTITVVMEFIILKHVKNKKEYLIYACFVMIIMQIVIPISIKELII